MAIEARKKDINDEIALQWQEYTQSLNHRLGTITDFRKDFEKVFEGFIENTLPRDDLYREIEKSMTQGKGTKTATAAK